MNLSNFRHLIILFILMASVIVGYVKTSRLNEVELVSGLGIDKVDDHYSITLQVFNPSANQKNAVDPTGGFTYNQTGKTIPEAIEKIKKETLKDPILDTLQVVALSDRLAKKEGLKETLDFLVRDPRVPANISTIVIKNQSPELFLQLFTPQQKLSALYTNIMLKNSKEAWGHLVNSSSERIKSYLEDNTSDMVIPYIEVHGDIEGGTAKSNIEDFSPAAHVSLEGFATFKGENLHSYLTLEESNTLALIRGINQVVSLSAPCPDAEEDFTISTFKTSSTLKAETDPVSFKLKIAIEGNLEEKSCKMDFTKPAIQKKLENQLKTKIKSDIQALIKKSSEDGTDTLGLSDALYRQHPDVWKKKRKDKDFFSTINVDTSIDVRFIRFGHTKQ
ncbi:Ger(x)C family spore germination protein [Rossellomorea sp. NPDC071047]|uniref:Ger(x)C family spore germination protein n=1 Tax=Rossellomorea sp. NPDC071047 TaxID=3390675 RepID=UPI003D08843C